MNKQEVKKVIDAISLINNNIDLECSYLNNLWDKCYPVIITALEQQLTNSSVIDAVNAISEGKTVTCTVDGGDPVVYKVKYITDENSPYFGTERLAINEKVYDFRDFNISISQILYGKWEVVDK